MCISPVPWTRVFSPGTEKPLVELDIRASHSLLQMPPALGRPWGILYVPWFLSCCWWWWRWWWWWWWYCWSQDLPAWKRRRIESETNKLLLSHNFASITNLNNPQPRSNSHIREKSFELNIYLTPIHLMCEWSCSFIQLQMIAAVQYYGT